MLLAGIAIGVAATVFGLARSLAFLLFGSRGTDGADLLLRRIELDAWFAGQPVYGVIDGAVYPPASYVLLWPFMGWGSPLWTRWLWGILGIVALAWLIRRALRDTGLTGRASRLWLGIAILSVEGIARTTRLGQLSFHAFVPLIGGVLLINRRNPTWLSDLLATALILSGLSKPTLVAPMIWLAVLVPGRMRPAVLIGGGYIALTLLATSFQPGSPLDLIRAWLGQGGEVNVSVTSANIHLLLHSMGADRWVLPAALVLLSGTGIWVAFHRRVDLWILLGITAFVSRFWVYHRDYDDALLVIPLIALVRVAAGTAEGSLMQRMAVAVAAATWLSTLVSSRYLRSYPQVQSAADAVQTWVWLGALAFLLAVAWRMRSAAGRESVTEQAA